MKRTAKPRKKEGGAIVVTFALFLVLMLGFMSLAMDFGHLNIVRTELQTSMDACALAGAQELNGQPDSLTRATNAAIAAGNANAVDLQSAAWKNKPKITAADISFRDQNHNPGATAATARYVRCAHTQANTNTPMVRMLPGMTAAAATMNVGAFAEATTTPAQSVCPVPLALYPKTGATGPNYGFAVGDWVTLLASTPSNGQIGWANLNNTNSAQETADELKGFCGTRVGSQLSTPGVQQSVADTWNKRFGIYANKADLSTEPPDFTSYIYTTTSYPAGRDAYADFVNKRLAFASCGTDVRDCETKAGYKSKSLKNNTSLATPGPSGELRNFGTNRRLVAVPVVGPTAKVTDFVCMLMLQPLPTPMTDIQLEFRGNASAPGSPCIGNGLPGGTAGPLVPVLVR